MISFLDVSEEVTINLEEAAALEEDNLDEEEINCQNCLTLKLFNPNNDNIHTFM